eukprot:TRINITY_DN291_c0_g3_i1.p1 TRINITY_DN291_c0_g3~~TRINITY_DN291_c0_g3_i1.p1  ORF type:complete len:1408 (+),score=723.87 TRINITY_DN291_c0_g3_i1:55-4278(+)
MGKPKLGEAGRKNSSLARMYGENAQLPTQEEIDKAVMPIIGHEDMTKMDDMNEETLLQNVKIRYETDLIYTFTSAILIAVNPFKFLPVYSQAWVKKYVNKRLGLLSPHIFSIAEAAYSTMSDKQLNVSILISGESGSGKTECTKLILRYLAARMDKTSKVETMLLETNPVLEALGNAKTVRNDNSSRFGKYIEIIFDQNNLICGAKITTYLLEKSRICRQSENERNYHIFYQITQGCTEEDRALYKLKNAEYYSFMNTSGCISIPGVNEEHELKGLRSAWKLFEISKEQQESILRLLSAVLYFGNIKFADVGNGSQIRSEFKEAFDTASEMLSLKPDALLPGVRTRVMFVRGEKMVIELNAEKSRDAIEALAKALYSALFDWTVQKLNDSLFVDKYTSRNFIGVLDIFGFEHFKFNTMEQFLINFANEKLQKFFNHHIFSMEQEEYEREKINWANITFKDNQECLDLIEKRPVGILAVLDEESKFPKATDETFTSKLHQNFVRHVNYEKPRIGNKNFKIIHYAGVVEYDTNGWLDKNKDELPEHTLEILRSSPNKFITLIFTEKPIDPAILEAMPASKKGEKKGSNKLTLGTQFKISLQSLTDLMQSTDPYFVRCVKPNMAKIPNNFNDEEVQAQLRYAGMLETIRIRRLGYPIRYPYREFYQRYKCLVESRHHSSGEPAERVAGMLGPGALFGNHAEGDTWQKGLTKVFLKQTLANELEDRRSRKLAEILQCVQNWWRMITWRSKFTKFMRSSKELQLWWRCKQARKKWIRERKAATTIQSTWRMVRAVRLRKKMLEEKRRREEEALRKKEEERKRRIAKGEMEAVLREEAEERDKHKKEIEKIKKGAKGRERELRKDERAREEQARLADAGPAPVIAVDQTIYCAPITLIALSYASEKILDLDLTALAIDKNGQVIDCAFYNQRKADNGAMILDNDDRTGTERTKENEGSRDNESIVIDFAKLAPHTRFIVILATCYSDGYSLRDTEHCLCEIRDNSNAKILYSENVREHVLAADIRTKHTAAQISILAKSETTWIVKPSLKLWRGMHWLDVLPLIRRALNEENLVPRAEEQPLPKPFRAIKGEEITVPLECTKLMCGLGWEGEEDLDLAVLLFRYSDYLDHVDPVRHRYSKDGAIIHKGDSKTGKGTDDERVFVDLASISKRVNTIVFVVTVFAADKYQGGFGRVKNAHVRLSNATSAANIHDSGKEMIRYPLSSTCGNRTAQIVCKMYRIGSLRWAILAMGEPSSGAFYEHLIKRLKPYLDPSPPFRSFKVTIHSGKNMPTEKFAPRIKVVFDLDSQRTKVIKTKKIKWKEELILSGEAEILDISLYNHRLGKDVFMGRISLPVANDIRKRYFKLEGRGKKKDKIHDGELRISLINITGTDEAKPSAEAIQRAMRASKSNQSN